MGGLLSLARFGGEKTRPTGNGAATSTRPTLARHGKRQEGSRPLGGVVFSRIGSSRNI